MEINEYVKTKFNEIGKITELCGNNCCGELYKLDIKEQLYSEGNIIKHSKDIIDLIENDEIVVIEYYVAKYRQRISRKFIVNKCIPNYIVFENVHCNWSISFENNKWNWNESKGFNPKITSVLTKQQFESNAYKIEKER